MDENLTLEERAALEINAFQDLLNILPKDQAREPGWFTRDELAAHYGICRETVRTRLTPHLGTRVDWKWAFIDGVKMKIYKVKAV